MSVVLEAKGLTRDYSVRRGILSPPAIVHALADVSFDLESGKTLAIVGESGSGKSTLARLITMIEEPTAGTLRINGIDLAAASKAERRHLRSEVQIVFQNPYGSLNPRQTIGDALEEPLIVNRTMSAAERSNAVSSMMARVGLRPEFRDRYPHMFSGGQRQRIAIARVTSVTAGTGISVSASTGSVTISSTSSGGVTSLNAQTGAVVTTSLDVIGSMSVLMYAGNSSLSGINNTAAGSSLRYDPTLYRGTANGPFNGWCYANNSSSYTGGGSALSGTWRKMSSGSVYNVSGPPCNTDYTWAQALWVRIS